MRGVFFVFKALRGSESTTHALKSFCCGQIYPYTRHFSTYHAAIHRTCGITAIKSRIMPINSTNKADSYFICGSCIVSPCIVRTRIVRTCIAEPASNHLIMNLSIISCILPISSKSSSNVYIKLSVGTYPILRYFSIFIRVLYA